MNRKELPEQCLKNQIHTDAREATARQVCRAIMNQERFDISVAIVLQALDDWYERGMETNTNQKNGGNND